MSDDYWHHIYIDYRPNLPTRYNGLPDRCGNHSDHGPAKGRWMSHMRLITRRAWSALKIIFGMIVFAAMAAASIWRETPPNFILLSPINK